MTAEMSDAAFANVFGATDSEHIAGLYITFLTSFGPASNFENTYHVSEMLAALQKTIATIITLQEGYLGEKRTPNSLNLCVTDGVSIVAVRFRNHRTSQPPTLYYSTKAGTTLNRKYTDHPDGIHIAGVTDVGKADSEHGKHLIIASEPSTYREEDWELIGKNQYVLAGPEGGFKVGNLVYEKAWEAEDRAAAVGFD